MFCPECRCEYVEGIKECADCKVPLARELAPGPERDYVDLVTVLATGNRAIIAVAKSILESAGIRYFVKGELLQDLFALGGLGLGYNPAVGAFEMQVGQDDEEDARELLRDLEEGGSDSVG